MGEALEILANDESVEVDQVIEKMQAEPVQSTHMSIDSMAADDYPGQTLDNKVPEEDKQKYEKKPEIEPEKDEKDHYGTASYDNKDSETIAYNTNSVSMADDYDGNIPGKHCYGCQR